MYKDLAQIPRYNHTYAVFAAVTGLEMQLSEFESLLQAR